MSDEGRSVRLTIPAKFRAAFRRDKRKLPREVLEQIGGQRVSNPIGANGHESGLISIC